MLAPIESSSSFSAENAESSLRACFAEVSEYPVDGWVTFADTATAHDYVSSSIIHGHLANRVPEFIHMLRARRRNVIFKARS